MLKKMRKQLNNEKGLTLIELLAVIVILAIIAAIAVPAIGGTIQNSREKAVIAEALNALEAANLYFVDNPNAEEIELTGAGGVGGSDYLVPGYFDSVSNLTSATVTKADEVSGNRIVFVGVAGKKTLTVATTGVTKADLSMDDAFNEVGNVTQ